jgi:thymidylate synthase (FAD)
MKILKNEGSFEILSISNNIIENIAKAARTCYQSQDKASPANDLALVKNIIKRGHGAMLEFADLTVQFNNCSRGFTHEMVRHRPCSYAQESTRYVNESNLLVVVPPHKDENEEIIHYPIFSSEKETASYSVTSLKNWIEMNESAYQSLIKAGWKPEDARTILPTNTKSQIVVKTNVREWRHILSLRCDMFAHWEIRAVMLKLLKWCQENIPVIFDDFHFFDNGRYARMIPSKEQIKDTLRHFYKTLPIEQQEAIIEELIKSAIKEV